MSPFRYRAGLLHAEAVAITEIAAALETPFYCYSSAALADAYRAFAEAFAERDALIAYSLKANSNQAVIATFAELGAGADVVSEGEVRRALAAGVPGQRIVFSGVGKTRAEMALALEAGVLQLNLESEAQLAALSEIAVSRAAAAPVAFRVNPDVDAWTHDKIATGRKADKFGLPIDRARAAYAEAAKLPGIEVIGVAVHIGSQLTDLAPFRTAFGRLAELVAALRGDGHDIRQLDLGGGLGVRYRDESPPAPADYARLVDDTVGTLGCRLLIEPGRALVAEAGLLIARVIEVKRAGDRRFVIIDAAMNDLLRPALYGAWHAVDPVRAPSPHAPRTPVDIAGPVCESGDVLATGRLMAPLKAGDLLAVGAAGAYGAVMASSYNSRLPAPEVMVSGGRFAVVRPRGDYDDLIARDRLPDWLALAGRPARRRGAA